MNLFQWLTVPVLSAVALFDVVIGFRNRGRLRLLRIVLCLVAGGLILNPGSATSIASMVGIGRGTDFVVYTFMLVATGVLLHFYGRQFTLRRDLVELARREALRDPIAGTGLLDTPALSRAPRSIASSDTVCSLPWGSARQKAQGEREHERAICPNDSPEEQPT